MEGCAKMVHCVAKFQFAALGKAMVGKREKKKERKKKSGVFVECRRFGKEVM